MGYYANANGFIDYKWKLDEDEIKEAEKILGRFMGYVNWCGFEKNGVKFTGFNFSDDGKYYEDEVEYGLKKLQGIAPIRAGECRFAGEDDAHWRFVFRDGKWVEQSGHVVYDDC